MEGLFLKLLCQEMWRTTGSGQGAFLPQGLAGDIYRDFLTEAYAGKMAEAGGLGLSRLIVNHLDR
jgi:Rod binding domain-containing protein